MSGLAALETPQQQTVRCGADLARKGGGITGMSRAGAMITLSEAEWVIRGSAARPPGRSTDCLWADAPADRHRTVVQEWM
jgi:hypothetical protein